MATIVVPPSAARTALQARFRAGARHIVHPNHADPLPVGRRPARRDELPSELPARDGTIRVAPVVVAYRAPLALVQHFNAAASGAVLVREAQRGARLAITCVQRFINWCNLQVLFRALILIPPDPSLPKT